MRALSACAQTRRHEPNGRVAALPFQRLILRSSAGHTPFPHFTGEQGALRPAIALGCSLCAHGRAWASTVCVEGQPCWVRVHGRGHRSDPLPAVWTAGRPNPPAAPPRPQGPRDEAIVASRCTPYPAHRAAGILTAHRHPPPPPAHPSCGATLVFPCLCRLAHHGAVPEHLRLSKHHLPGR